MAKRDNSGRRTNTIAARATTSTPDAPTAPDGMEQRMLAFAEQLGRIAGTVQAKTEGWMDRDALNQQIASVRDSATELLEHLKTTVTNATAGENAAAKKSGETAPATIGRASAAVAPAAMKGRSRGAVDAPGKKHRKPTPNDSRRLAADAKASNQRAGRSMVKTGRLRGRG